MGRIALLVAAAALAGCVPAGAAIGANDAEHNASHGYGLKQIPGPDGHTLCRIRCRRRGEYCYNAAIDVCKTTWTGDQSAEAISSDNPLQGHYEMVIECSPPVVTADVCR